jgi:hypothetical protein
MKNGLSIGAMIALVLSSASAFANRKAPDPYQKLRAVDISPSHAPQLGAGVGGLSLSESRYQERLPVQLGGAVEKVSRREYQHSSKKFPKF